MVSTVVAVLFVVLAGTLIFLILDERRRLIRPYASPGGNPISKVGSPAAQNPNCGLDPALGFDTERGFDTGKGYNTVSYLTPAERRSIK